MLIVTFLSADLLVLAGDFFGDDGLLVLDGDLFGDDGFLGDSALDGDLVV